ncbi:hypothetical protein CPJCM30710_11440 [Clostridium polyendosporum]|uniref:HNH domain-containing protein n=1 Tax=Clostridium polyendosporum TaxID=69208 RepID=A0A919S0Q2_9CLOT|nr:HNH endonuclease [Clostridium polyendosporum]GIM28478.1 hypothetical protein CPJCM30710_11440 [Clostridium polyendosporum]
MFNPKYICDLCEREVSKVSEHHLIPKKEGGRNLNTAFLCIPCHTQVHTLYTNKELAARLYNIALLKDDIKIKRYLKFITKHPGDAHISIKKSRHVRRFK